MVLEFTNITLKIVCKFNLYDIAMQNITKTTEIAQILPKSSKNLIEVNSGRSSQYLT